MKWKLAFLEISGTKIFFTAIMNSLTDVLSRRCFF
jgi:hypothetical protein